MDWSRVKTIMIALLLGVNIFLLITYIRQDNMYRRDELATRSDVCTILREQGIEVEEKLIPLDSVTISPALLENSEIDTRKAATAVLGSVAESETEGGIVYTGKSGNILFSQNSFSLVYSAERKVESATDAIKLAREISGKFGISANLNQIKCESDSGGYIIKIPQSFAGIHVFNYDVSAKISETGSVISYGKIAGGGRITYTDDDVMSTSAVMMQFADAVEGRNSGFKITAVELGYAAVASAPNVISLAPVIRIETDIEIFYMNAKNGELMSF